MFVCMFYKVPYLVRTVNPKRYDFANVPENGTIFHMSKYESLFTQRVIEVIENRRRDRNMTIDDLCAATGIGRNSYYNKIRGDRCFNTEEIDAIARVLGCDPLLILEEASAKAQIESDAQLAKKAFARMQTLVAKPGDTKAEQEAYEELP